MKNNLINFIFTINKRNKTIKDIVIIFIMPWLQFILAVVLNFFLIICGELGVITHIFLLK